MSSEVDSSLKASANLPTPRAMNLRNQLKFYLKEKGWNAATLSKKTGVSRQVLSLWMSGAQPRNIEQVRKVAKTLGTDVDNLCFGSGEEVEVQKVTELDALLGDKWISGLFEVRFRRVKRA